MKNDITYEYRVFTNRLVDVESMKVGECSSKVIKELKQKDKVEGRFFHTTDSDEWFFYWKGKLQKLNLKGDSDVNAALEEVRKLIGEASSAVDNVNEIAKQASDAAESAQNAAKQASDAVESIGNKADKKDVEDVKSVVDVLSDKVDAIKVPSLDSYATKEFVGVEISKIDVPTKVSELENDKKYLTEHQDISGKQDVISDLDVIRSGAAAGATALQVVPAEYVTEEELVAKGYLTSVNMDSKQDVIEDLDDIRANAELAKTALQEIPEDYITETELEGKGYLTEHQSLDNYYTKKDIDDMIGVAKEITDTILNINNA